MLFGYFLEEDIFEFVYSYFDIKIGYKVESKSYWKIVGSIGYLVNSILFLIDVFLKVSVVEEVDIYVVVVVIYGSVGLIDDGKVIALLNFLVNCICFF